jgi:Fe-S-cluster containining protein
LREAFPKRNFEMGKQGKQRTRKEGTARDSLPEGLTAAELGARRAERLGTVEALKTGRTPLKVIEVAERAAALAEKAVEEFMAADPPPPLACREGCDWCCHLPVGAAAPEVLRIAEYLRRTLSPEELQATRQRAAALDDHKRRISLGERANAPLPCPLLVNRRCSAYPVRPLTCRGFNSSDARRCERSLRASQKVTVPHYVPQLRLTTFVLDGLRAGLSESGLKDDLLELTAALRIAVETPDAAERWLAGDAVFAAAQLS